MSMSSFVHVTRPSEFFAAVEHHWACSRMHSGEHEALYLACRNAEFILHVALFNSRSDKNSTDNKSQILCFFLDVLELTSFFK